MNYLILNIINGSVCGGDGGGIMKGKFKGLILFMLFMSCNAFAQRIIGYYPNYNYSAASATNIQWQKMTHLNYFSLNPDGTTATNTTGTPLLNDGYSWFTTTSFTDVIAKAKAKNPNIRIFIVSGGAPGSDGTLNDRFYNIATTPAKLNRWCDQIIKFIKQYGLNGWDLDWEFPNTTAYKNAHVTLLTKMRSKLDSMGVANCAKYELSIAVGGGYTSQTCWNPAHTTYILQAAIDQVDFVNIMSYDGPTSSGSPSSCYASSPYSHQDYTSVFVRSYNDWQSYFTIPASKVNMGVGFYDNAGNRFASYATAANYNATYFWGTGGSSCEDMKRKVAFVKSKSASGVVIWELTQDNLCTGTTPTCYSLLDCIYQYTTLNWGSAPPPTAPCSQPVELVSFSAQRSGAQVELAWVTATEKNSERFEVQKSVDGETFHSINTIPAKGTSTSLSYYSSADLNPLSNVTYYRLAQYDTDGSLAYSKVVNVSDITSLDAKILPNPFSKEVYIQLSDIEGNDGVTIIISSIEGKELLYKHYAENDLADITLGESLPSGTYIIKILSGGKSTIQKMVKQ